LALAVCAADGAIRHALSKNNRQLYHESGGNGGVKEDVDIAVIITRGKMEDASVIARPLFSFPCCVVASPQLIARTGMPTNSEQLTALPCITTVSALAGQAWQFAAADGSFKKVNVNGHYRVNSGEMALHAALAGVGFAILGRNPAARLSIAVNSRKSRWSCRRRRYSSPPSIGSATLCPPERASGLNLSSRRWPAKRRQPTGVR
jgi:DNA-binding transcriptional LysR family regulator